MSRNLDPSATDQDEMRYRLWQLWHELREESDRADALRERLQALERSRSWRVTAPLRMLMAHFARRRALDAAPPPLQPSDAAPTAAPVAGDDALVEEAWRSQLLSEALSPDKAGQLFVDVTELALQDLSGGIQRVVRKILSELVYAGPSTHRLVPVRLCSEGRYVHANRFYADFLGLPEFALGYDAPLASRPGDCFLGLDLLRDRAGEIGGGLAELRGSGVRIVIVVYDLLPLTQPEWFPDGVPERFREWIRTIASQADRWACISGTVKSECERLLADMDLLREIELFAFPLGADAVASFGAGPPALPATASREDRYLMVGTIEPRKSHAQALAAFEQLWREGSRFQLIIAGGIGWDVGPFARALKKHHELGRRLHWIEKPDDRVLGALYGECGTLLQASLGEGLGLPIIEARRAGCRLVLRDLPVFREVGGADAVYFDGNDPDCIVNAVARNVREASLEGWKRSSYGTATWTQSAETLVARSLANGAGHNLHGGSI